MAKELPYFQFEPAEYLTKDISFCSLAAQGLFVNLCSYYWQRNCNLTKDQFLRRLNHADILDELITEGVIKLNGSNITIDFLDKQRVKAIGLSETNSTNGKKGGRTKKPKETEIKPTLNPIESESKGIRREEIIQNEIIEDNTIFDFEQALVDYGFQPMLVRDWLKVRRSKKGTNTQTAFDAFIKVIKKAEFRGLDKNAVMSKCVEKDWRGLEFKWLENIGMVGKIIPIG